MLHLAKKTEHAHGVDNFFLDANVRKLLGSGKATSERRYVALFLKLVNAGELSASEWMALRTGTDTRTGGDKFAVPEGFVETQRKMLWMLIDNESMVPLHRSNLVGLISGCMLQVPEPPE